MTKAVCLLRRSSSQKLARNIAGEGSSNKIGAQLLFVHVVHKKVTVMAALGTRPSLVRRAAWIVAGGSAASGAYVVHREATKRARQSMAVHPQLRTPAQDGSIGLWMPVLLVVTGGVFGGLFL